MFSVLTLIALSAPVTTIASDTRTAIDILDTTSDADTIRQIEDGWRAAHWDTWAAAEAAAHRNEAKTAAAHLLEWDGSWRVDYLPRELHAALAWAWTRHHTQNPPPAVYYRRRIDADDEARAEVDAL